MAFGVGLKISINLLWVRISYCSADSLCTKVERLTLYLFFSVGSGTGPTILALLRSAVSTIVFTALSIILLSYALILILTRGSALVTFLSSAFLSAVHQLSASAFSVHY